MAKCKNLTPVEQDVLDQVQVRPLCKPDDVSRCDELIIEYHYLHDATLVGEHLRYALTYKGRWLAVATWSGAALRLGSQTVVADSASGPGIFAFVRQHGPDFALVILNTADEAKRLPKNKTPLPAATELRALLGEPAEFALDDEGRLPGVTVPPKSAWILARAR